VAFFRPFRASLSRSDTSRHRLGSFQPLGLFVEGNMLRLNFRSSLMRFVKIALAAATLLPLTSHAVLGGAPAAGSSAPVSLRATRQAASSTASTASASSASVATPAYSTAAYSVYESRDADGITVREYVLPSNVVFALTWQGPVRPDMKALLGNYFPNFVSAGEERLRGTGALIQHNGELQIESAGRPGHFFGTAYLPRLVPADLRANNLQ
jgi:hypothetical protein